MWARDAGVHAGRISVVSERRMMESCRIWRPMSTDGSWGSATDINSVGNAMQAVGATMDDTDCKAASALKLGAASRQPLLRVAPIDAILL